MNNTSQNTGCLGILLSIFSPAKKERKELPVYPYGLRDNFLSPAELSFYHVLKPLTTDKQTLLTKVNLNDLFYVKRPNENRGARNRIDRKHVDFVVCHAETMHPLFAVELDDSSHQRKDRKERDAFVDQVFSTAKLPLLHVPAQRAYNTTELSKMIEECLKEA